MHFEINNIDYLADIEENDGLTILTIPLTFNRESQHEFFTYFDLVIPTHLLRLMVVKLETIGELLNNSEPYIDVVTCIGDELNNSEPNIDVTTIHTLTALLMHMDMSKDSYYLHCIGQLKNAFNPLLEYRCNHIVNALETLHNSGLITIQGDGLEQLKNDPKRIGIHVITLHREKLRLIPCDDFDGTYLKVTTTKRLDLERMGISELKTPYDGSTLKEWEAKK